MSGLRFCFLTTFYPPHNFGGDGIAVQRLARGLVRAGHQVTVVHDTDAFAALSAVPAGASPAEPDGLTVIPLRSGVGALSPLLTQQLGRPVVNGRRIARLLRDGDFDVINFHNISLIGGPGLLKYGRALKLYMAHEHWLVCPTHVLWRYGREACPARDCVRCQLTHGRPPQLWRHTGLLEGELHHVDAFIAMSEFSRQKHREFGFAPEMEVLPSFLPPTSECASDAANAGSSERPQTRPYHLFVGRLERLKGVQDLLPHFAGDGDVDLLIAGDGTYASVLRSMAAGMPRVRFLGRTAADDLVRYYRHAVALLVPSLCFETFGMVLLEAFRESTPVIARRLGPFVEMVESTGAGALFSDAPELAAAMQGLQRDPARRAAAGAAALDAFAARWQESVVIPGYLEIVRRAAERRADLKVLAALPPRRVA